MTTAPGADELRIRHLLRTRGVSYTPSGPPTPKPPHSTAEEPAPVTVTILLCAVIAAAALAACLVLRRPIGRDTAVLAGAVLGICASTVAWSPTIGGLIHG